MAQIIMSHRGVARGIDPLPPLSILMGAAGGPGGLRCVTFAPFCSAAAHFRECQLEQGEWRGSLPINIWGALVAAAVYLTEHAPGPPRRARHRGADSVTLSLTPLAPPYPHLSRVLYCYLSLSPELHLPLHPSQFHRFASYLSTSVVSVITFHLCSRVPCYAR